MGHIELSGTKDLEPPIFLDDGEDRDRFVVVYIIVEGTTHT